MTSVTMGRPRDERIDAAVLAATVDMLDDKGYAGLTMEGVASRAGTSKTAIRRRWPSRQHLVIDALAGTISAEPPPDTGCTHCDLIKDIESLTNSFSRIATGRALQGLLADLHSAPELVEVFNARLFLPRREATATALRRGIERGDIRSDMDIELLVDLLAATTYFRIFFGHLPVTTDLAEKAVTVFMSGVATPQWRHTHVESAHSVS